ncbi:hypothetical protein T4E_8262 [Trichinella pseudospiralis]|uniref:Uncharacterized protein n=1 Tax=Trichinella pseudospiralis TaxID=6337 RepID=A0A0V0XKI5_TRIPS|nr:hypothetical protein T4E_6445 [Trichinella pseudospiralis]KRX88480.1 hypothetical protein T4E_8262 [Trichinella pseudospiralis]
MAQAPAERNEYRLQRSSVASASENVTELPLFEEGSFLEDRALILIEFLICWNIT